MIVGIEGTIEHKEPAFVHVNVNGLIYEVFISLQSYAAITKERVKLHTSHVIREDAQLLYGFIDKSEKLLFERLVKISGVGPKVAMAICSSFSSAQFGEVIAGSNINALKRVPGVGPKSAGRILVELNGFDTVLLEQSASANPASNEAKMALESLGFKKEQIAKVLSNCSATDTAGLVKEALKQLQKL
jgi:Holliday junction DNA helicase RuvA